MFTDPELSRVILFTRTKHRANRVAEQLEKMGVPAEAIHGNKSQAARQKALKRFRAGNCRVLVATDIAARGIDIDGVTHVINFELPNEQSYVHRIGRTARASASGVAIAFCDPSERKYLRDIEKLLKMSLTVVGDGPKGEETAPPKRQGRGGGKVMMAKAAVAAAYKPANANGKPAARRQAGWPKPQRQPALSTTSRHRVDRCGIDPREDRVSASIRFCWRCFPPGAADEGQFGTGLPPPPGAHTTRGCKDGLIFVRKRMPPRVFQISPLTLCDACALRFRVDFQNRSGWRDLSLGMLRF